VARPENGRRRPTRPGRPPTSQAANHDQQRGDRALAKLLYVHALCETTRNEQRSLGGTFSNHLAPAFGSRAPVVWEEVWSDRTDQLTIEREKIRTLDVNLGNVISGS